MLVNEWIDASNGLHGALEDGGILPRRFKIRLQKVQRHDTQMLFMLGSQHRGREHLGEEVGGPSSQLKVRCASYVIEDCWS